jgi:hypothetical protein
LILAANTVHGPRASPSPPSTTFELEFRA